MCAKIQADGYTAAKFNVVAFDENAVSLPRERTTGPLTHDILAMADVRLAAVRARCGDDFGIILENLCGTDVTAAVQLEHVARKYGVLMIEEATSNFNPELYAEIARRTETPLAAGERVQTRWGFEQLLKQRAISVIQPDITNCGGLSEAKKICDMAHIYDVRVQCHVAGTPIAEAAAIQLEAAIPNFYIHETYNMAAHPDCVSYGKYAYVPENGYLTVPDLPGIGQELSDQAIAEALDHIEVR